MKFFYGSFIFFFIASNIYSSFKGEAAIYLIGNPFVNETSSSVASLHSNSLFGDRQTRLSEIKDNSVEKSPEVQGISFKQVQSMISVAIAQLQQEMKKMINEKSEKLEQGNLVVQERLALVQETFALKASVNDMNLKHEILKKYIEDQLVMTTSSIADLKIQIARIKRRFGLIHQNGIELFQKLDGVLSFHELSEFRTNQKVDELMIRIGSLECKLDDFDTKLRAIQEKLEKRQKSTDDSI